VRVIKFPRETSVKTKRTGIIPITYELEQLITEIKLYGYVADAASESDVSEEPPLFAINGNTFDHHWRRLIIDTKISDLHFHDLRHEATSRFFERGLNVAEVMSVTGHSTTEMVDRYRHYSAPLVLEKLQQGITPEALAAHVALLFENFMLQSGDVVKLRDLVQRLFMPVVQ